MTTEKSVDALIVGAGFCGLHMLQKLRKLNFKTTIYESGGGIGGTWYWNRYPGARVDCEFTCYQYAQDEIWKDFEWAERFPGQEELEKYFKHVDEKLNLSKDIKFNTTVTSATFYHSRNQWLVRTNFDGILTWANSMILCTGSTDLRYTPPFKGLSNFNGTTCHTRLWPKHLNVAGKRVAVIGTGASGVQVIQEIASEVSHLTVYQRTPNIALPMQQLTIEDQRNWKFPSLEKFQELLEKSRTTFSGLDYEYIPSNGADASPDERRAVFEDLLKRGGFYYIAGTYQDILLNQETNDAAYDCWCETTRARINNPAKRDILAPLKPPHAYGAKRPSLEQHYYEVFNQSNVDIINIRTSPIIEITEDGIKTELEGETKVDIIVFATGFDNCTGALLDIDIKTDESLSLRNKWKNGVWTNAGITTAGFPNMFFLYGPQAPTAFANGAYCAEFQGDWVIRLLVYMRNESKTKVVATEEAEQNWKKIVSDTWNMSLCPAADSWYQGANIPGKVREPLFYAGGIPRYLSVLEDSAKNNYSGFVLT